ncbi:NAD-dependent protein deacetylase sirtuin-3, mitochondrial isoform X2 [Pristis pectinata]|uniref:NAD-dependent protein deacetylase sirtuin-3, mitochondrial isoform X2 n=1 Tax=Pristis pectinata TaxID=685728 RepID=UPI00223E0A16|nr:NAD-dependent protein deacetylase sirtuin-3, mitochondrial isoform X2 [Pristis pectinata]
MQPGALQSRRMRFAICLRILCTPPRLFVPPQLQCKFSRFQHFRAETLSEATPDRQSHRKTSRNHCVNSQLISPPVRYIFSGSSSDEKVQSLQDITRLILSKKCSKVVVMCGAGISTPSGIPDFRSAGSGLYDNLQQYDLPYPEAIFDINYFAHNPKPFFALAKQLYPGHCKPNYIHYFVRLLHQKGLLLRMYTQNIDGLERRAGIPPEKLVEAHGSFATATCTVCRERFTWERLRGDVMEGKVPHCSLCSGVIKPDIVFFGEQLPRNFYQHLIDFPFADLLIILGTSLEVEPFASLSEMVRNSVPRILINQDVVGSLTRNPLRTRDVVELGDVVRGVKRFSDLLGWDDDVNELLTREHSELEDQDHVESSPSH